MPCDSNRDANCGSKARSDAILNDTTNPNKARRSIHGSGGQKSLEYCGGGCTLEHPLQTHDFRVGIAMKFQLFSPSLMVDALRRNGKTKVQLANGLARAQCRHEPDG